MRNRGDRVRGAITVLPRAFLRKAVSSLGRFLLLTLPVMILPMIASPAASAATGRRAASSATTGCAGWSSAPPAQCHAGSAATPTTPVSVSPAWANGAGCSGYYTGSGEMNCRDTAYTINSFRVVIRQGFWTGSNGFGWSKAYYYHNLWMQPMIDTIRQAIPTGSNSSRNYVVYHYNPDGYVDQRVVVVADIVDAYFQGVYTNDGHSVGVITGYCESGSGAYETVCPDWVDSTL